MKIADLLQTMTLRGYFLSNNSGETWIIHESRLRQMQGTKDAVVVVHHKSFVTKQMPRDRLARRVKKGGNMIKSS